MTETCWERRKENLFCFWIMLRMLPHISWVVKEEEAHHVVSVVEEGKGGQRVVDYRGRLFWMDSNRWCPLILITASGLDRIRASFKG